MVLLSHLAGELSANSTWQSKGGVDIGEKGRWVLLNLLDLETFAGVGTFWGQAGSEGSYGYYVSTMVNVFWK